MTKAPRYRLRYAILRKSTLTSDIDSRFPIVQPLPLALENMNMETRFTATIQYNENGSCSIPACVKSLSDALTVAFAECTYYLAYNPTVYVTIEENCAQCDGEGTIRVKRPRSVQVKRCPNCRGHVGPISSVSFPVRPHCNVKTIDNGAGQTYQHCA